MCFKNRFRFIIGLLLTVLMTLTLAMPATAEAPPSPPPACDGVVKMENGTMVATGTLTALVDNEVKGTQTIVDGQFLSFIITGVEGTDEDKPITFKVNILGIDYNPISVTEKDNKPVTWNPWEVYTLTITIPNTSTPTKVTGNATDADVNMDTGNTAVSANNTWVLNITQGTVKGDVSASDLDISGMPFGLSATAAKGAANSIVITVAGTASPAVGSTANVSIVVKGSAVTETEATDSAAIAVMVNPAAVAPIQVAGTAGDAAVTMASGNTAVSPGDNTWTIDITQGTVKGVVSASDLILTGMPAGLNAAAAKGTGNAIVVTVAGAASPAVSTVANVGIVVKGSAVTETGATDSASIAVTVNPAQPPADTLEISVQAASAYRGQPSTISASAVKGDDPVSVAWQVSVGGESVAPIPSTGTECTASWSPETFLLPVEKQYDLVVTATSEGEPPVTETGTITFYNYSIYVEGFGSGGSAELVNLDAAVEGHCVFQFFNGNTPVGCKVVPCTIGTGENSIPCGAIPLGADKVKISVVKFGSEEDPWKTLSSFYEFSL
ncbi:MAG: hypothetical protein HPY50_11770 [Firmicutes bacterium]|nr:hypothetical protein [Bacillota bacterium]